MKIVEVERTMIKAIIWDVGGVLMKMVSVPLFILLDGTHEVLLYLFNCSLSFGIGSMFDLRNRE